ncbi:transglutaminase-like domain-containing protein [Paenibacillus cisolokensis]|jgi:hypothetical protein|uniref:transglutaminase domain-containing protein n=1 Tax=Paenibacillus TaxID=44249 RepID=UPI0007202A2F|nr:transglutaminase-like domain-containing protein [Paenibacillus sp. 32O-W]ALS26738.1 transglutaminase [Paenibacillus sp. 32O-W]
MTHFVQALTQWEPVAVVVLLLLLGSLVQGMRRGASGSAKRLFFFIWEALLVVVFLFAAARLAAAWSPAAQRWLAARVTVPEGELGALAQLWYTLLTGMRDFTLLRFGILFLISYWLLRFAGSFLTPLAHILFERLTGDRDGEEERSAGSLASRAAGALIGAVHGAGRSLVLLAALFIYVSLVPGGPLAEGIRSSPLYGEASERLLQPVAGSMLADRGPVLTKAVEEEFQRILQRKYEIIDYNIPDDIAAAALQVTKDERTAEGKAKALYNWLGTRIAYDWEKARNYEERGIWKEQTPQYTFEHRKGVCIDTARLYALMARAAGLEARVVTGLGADGQGGFGPHAWNEVKVDDGRWIPLDATWASSGNWFDPPNFDETHIRGA